MSSMIECNKCFKKFEFSEKERNWYAEMGFKDPKKCKKCKGLQKNKRTYTYIPSKEELQRKDAMRTTKTTKTKNTMNNTFNVLNDDNEQVVIEDSRVQEVMKSGNWCDVVEDGDVMDWSVPVRWVN